MNRFLFFFSSKPYLADYANLLFRLVVGLSLMTHGYSKLIRLLEGRIWSRTHLFFNEETSLALVTFGEFFAPLFVILGLGTRLFSIPIIYTFIIVVFDAHWATLSLKWKKEYFFSSHISIYFWLVQEKFLWIT